MPQIQMLFTKQKGLPLLLIVTTIILHLSKNPKYKKINKLEVAEFIVARNIKMDLELMNSAVERKDLGDRELTKFVLRMNSKSCRELIDA